MNTSHVTSPVITISRPMQKSSINAMPMLPTSPAKHFALFFGRKLNKQNTSSDKPITIRNDSSTNPSSPLSAINGMSTANEYPPVMPLIPSIKL